MARGKTERRIKSIGAEQSTLLLRAATCVWVIVSLFAPSTRRMLSANMLSSMLGNTSHTHSYTITIQPFCILASVVDVSCAKALMRSPLRAELLMR
jgi:hypothetical protein